MRVRRGLILIFAMLCGLGAFYLMSRTPAPAGFRTRRA